MEESQKSLEKNESLFEDKQQNSNFWIRLGNRLEVPKDAEDEYYQNDKLTNRDLIPIPLERRKWSALTFFSYWIVEGVSISGYTTVSSLVGFGLSVRQSLGCAVAAGIIYGVMAVIMGWIGSHHHLGFLVFSRATFGIKGFYFPIIIRCITGVIWFGVQSYYGGQAVRVVIATMNPSFATWNTFAKTSGNISSADFVGLVIYMILILPCILIPPENLHNLFKVTFVMVFSSMMGMLIYAMHTNSGPGPMLTANSSDLNSRGALAWAVLQGIFSIVGTTGTGILGQSDWTRYSKSKNGPVVAQLVGAPIAVTFAGLMGALITSASSDLFGEAYWNPLDFLSALQAYEGNSAKARAGVFFAGCGFIGQQLAINLLLNSVSTGMDMSGLLPRFLNIRRASYIVAAISICCCPWYLQSSAKVVIIFGSGWGCFCSSLTGIVITKYYFIYKRKIVISHLYRSDSSSVYFFHGGIDWRSIVSWVLGTVFLMPGLAAAANDRDMGFWNWIFKLSYPWGIGISSISLMILHFLFPKMEKPLSDAVDDIYTGDGNLVSEYLKDDQSSTVQTQDMDDLPKLKCKVLTITREV